MKDKYISIVTIHKGDSRFLEATMDSALLQNSPYFEYIVVASGLSKEEKNKVESIANIFSFDKDKSLYDAMNIGIKLATGTHVLFLNSGDVFFDENVVTNIYKNIVNFESCIVMPVVYSLCGQWYTSPCHNKNEIIKSHNSHQGFLAPISREKKYFSTNADIYADSLWMQSYKSRYAVSALTFPGVVFDFSGLSSIPSLSRIPSKDLFGIYPVIKYLIKYILFICLPWCVYGRVIMFINKYKKIQYEKSSKLS